MTRLSSHEKPQTRRKHRSALQTPGASFPRKNATPADSKPERESSIYQRGLDSRFRGNDADPPAPYFGLKLLISTTSVLIVPRDRAS